MTTRSTVELRDLQIETRIGSDGPGVHAPDTHLLDLTLWIDPSLVLIEEDSMSQVFDYDPLVAEMERLARDGPYETQERLVTRMAKACADHSQIEAVELALRKAPIRARSGSLGVRLYLDGAALAELRQVPG
ncbi:dihydroneopterin aldolase [Hydrogenophaga sp.]|uniref:dihydroneopterin aldolase n=1 Tax=Hydrogenophaga sp. TaxID=1904254 RepID=UPI00271CEB94|nr:dihydroneopterin aldolase [Hydrogenophaga sp.]MDO8904027.1 dihydroneopterin aldolase [Hydrogenophaga sp.]